MSFFNFNGKLFPEPTAVIGPSNRAFRYGDGLFETIKYRNNELILDDEHFARLFKGMQLMQFERPKRFTVESLAAEISKTVSKNNLSHARVRLEIFRGDGGLYDALNHMPNYIIQVAGLTETAFNLNTNGLQLCIYRDALKSRDAFSNIKHNNYLPYFMGALFARRSLCNDALILNDQLRICDSTIANVFIIKDEVIYTPLLREGCVAGIMRKFIIQQLSQLGYHLKETELSEEMLLGADEVFLSNSIYNIRWVAAIEGKSYTNQVTRKIVDVLQQTNPAVFC